MPADIHLHPAVADRLRHHVHAVSWLNSMAVAYAELGQEDQARTLREGARIKHEELQRLRAALQPIVIPAYPA